MPNKQGIPGVETIRLLFTSILMDIPGPGVPGPGVPSAGALAAVPGNAGAETCG